MSSYVDSITNATVISDIDLRAHLPNLLKLEFPEMLLPTVLHESTHHWCFMSPVGNTLALLRMRAYRRATRLRSDGVGDPWDLLEDVLRQEATIEMLRPFAEGLACFEELDSIPGKSQAISRPMLATFFNFGGLDSEAFKRSGINPGLDIFLYGLLYRARTHHLLTQRRENVLSGHFTASRGGHLSGYLAVKNLWHHARKKSGLAWDAELFLCYLRSFIYDDYGLVAILLDPSTSEHNAVNAIARHLLERFKSFLSIDLEISMRAFEESYTRHREIQEPPGQHFVHPSFEGLGTDKTLVELGRSRVEALIGEITATDQADLVDRLMCHMDRLRLRKRELLCLGSLEASVAVNEHHRVIVHAVVNGGVAKDPTFAGSALEGITGGTEAGALEFYLIPTDMSRALVVSRAREVVFVHYEGPINDRRKQELQELFGSRTKDLKIVKEQEANLEHVISKEAIRIVRDNLKKTSVARIDEIYAWLATLHVDKAQWQKVADELQKGGVFKLLNENSDLLRGFAFLGVASSVEHSDEELSRLALQQDVDLDFTLKSLRQIEQAKGMPLLVAADGRTLALI